MSDLQFWFEFASTYSYVAALRVEEACARAGLRIEHRPSNVDDSSVLEPLIDALVAVAEECPLVLPAHPRAAGALRKLARPPLRVIEPLGYLDFIALEAGAAIVLTDSGGIQEETTALGVPCLTLRENTERPVTVAVGTNTLVGTDPAQIVPAAVAVLEGRGKKGRVPDLWDGRAAERIARILARFCEERGR